MSRPRVLLGDDHTLVLDGFRKLLEDRCEIVGVAEDGRTLLQWPRNFSLTSSRSISRCRSSMGSMPPGS